MKKHFGDTTLYEVLGVGATANKAQIRKAYLKLALVEHPDKGGNEDKFKALTVVYEVLGSPERREAYDRDGDIEDESAVSASEAQWTDYWRAMFKRVEAEDIESYKARYAGSEEEHNDAIAAYKLKAGVLSGIMTHIIAEDDAAETRVVAAIRAAIKAGTLEPIGDFKRSSLAPSKRTRGKATKATAANTGASALPAGAATSPASRRRRGARKSKPVASTAAAAGTSSSAAGGDEEEMDPGLLAAMKAAHSKRVAQAKSEEAEAAEMAAAMGLGSGMSSLELAIRRKQREPKGTESFLAGLAAKHGVDMGGFDDVGEEAFEATRRTKAKRVGKRR